MRVVQALELGDSPGHPFRGNQWTDAPSGDDAAGSMVNLHRGETVNAALGDDKHIGYFAQAITPATLSGTKLHVFADTPEKTASAAFAVHDTAAKLGIGMKVATPKFHETQAETGQRGKGVTLYLPRKATVERDTQAIVDALDKAGYRHRGEISGDTPVAGAVHTRYELSPNAPPYDLTPEEYHNYYVPAIHASAVIELGDLPGHEFHGNQWTKFRVWEDTRDIGMGKEHSIMLMNDKAGGEYVGHVTDVVGRHQFAGVSMHPGAAEDKGVPTHHIGMISVDPGYRREGVASQLMDEVYRRAKADDSFVYHDALSDEGRAWLKEYVKGLDPEAKARTIIDDDAKAFKPFHVSKFKSIAASVQEFGDSPGHPFHGNQWTDRAAATDAMKLWAGNRQNTAAIQKAAAKIAAGKEPKGEAALAARSFLTEIENSKPTTAPLYRGINMPWSYQQWKANPEPFKPGDVLNMPLAAFSDQQRWADNFMNAQVARGLDKADAGAAVMFELEPGAKAAPVEELRDLPPGYRSEGEHLTAGKFEIVRTEPYSTSVKDAFRGDKYRDLSGTRVIIRQVPDTVTASTILEFGDVEGHPFHGNQWTGGLAREHGEATGGISSDIKSLGISPAAAKSLQSAWKSKGFTINAEKQAQLQAAKDEAMLAIGAKLGYTPEQAAAGQAAVNDFMETWYMAGGQSDTRTAMEEAWVKLRDGGVPETDVERGAAMQKAYTDMVWDAKFGADTQSTEVIRGVGGEYAAQIQLADKLGESWTANTFPLTSWAVPSAETSVRNWVGDGIYLHGMADKDEVFGIYSGEPRLRESGLKVKGEFIMDGQGAVDDGNTTISPLEGGRASAGMSYGVDPRADYIADGMKFHEATGGSADQYALGRASFNGVDMGQAGKYSMSSPGLQSALGLDQPLKDEPVYDRWSDENRSKPYEEQRAAEDAAKAGRYTTMAENAATLSAMGHTPATMRDIAVNYSRFVNNTEEANKLEEGVRRGVAADEKDSWGYGAGTRQPSDQKTLDFWKNELIPDYREGAANALAQMEQIRGGLGITTPLVQPRSAAEIDAAVAAREAERAAEKARRGY